MLVITQIPNITENAKPSVKGGYTSVLGDVYPEDAHRPGVHRIVDRVRPRLREGSILILHDGSPLGEPDRSQTVGALDMILAHATAAGLRAVTVRELLDSAHALASLAV